MGHPGGRFLRTPATGQDTGKEYNNTACAVHHFYLIVLFYIDSLNKTRSLFYIKVHEAKKALIKDIGPINRAHLTDLVRVEYIYILCIV